jgi:hypothetical protein
MKGSEELDISIFFQVQDLREKITFFYLEDTAEHSHKGKKVWR